jgi:peptidoglycan/xylan/chitin deacetylase (PgdA/CDA1 family)
MSDEMGNPHGEPWQWPEQVWRPIVERVRAGRSLHPAAWPGGARCAVAIGFDASHEAMALGEGDESPVRLSQGEYASRRAMPRIRDLLQKEAVPATFFYPAVSALLHPDEVRGVARDGHEIAIHSWIHELNTTLPFEAERDLTLRAAEVLDTLAGRPCTGLRAAGREFSPHTLVILKEMELLYDSSLMADDAPYELLNDGEPTGVVELPPEWIRDDAAYFAMHRMTALRPYAPLGAVEEVFIAEFEGAWAEGGLFLLTLHPHLIGQRARLPLLQRLLRHIRARGGCWFGTHEQVARWCLARAPALEGARMGAVR